MSFIIESQHLRIPFQDIEAATNGFTTLIGKGGYGPVYKGELLLSGKLTSVAVKRLDNSNISGQGFKEFLTEIQLLCRYKHPNLVSLLGYCEEGDEKILIYEHAEHGSLDKYLCTAETTTPLTWNQRIKICIDAAHGLDYLHNRVAPDRRVIHRDIKSSNILLNQNWKAMISDLGLSKIGRANENDSYLITNASGTHGYCDPAYVKTGILTKESDVYSFGVVLFEVLCGRLCFLNVNNEQRFLPQLAQSYYEKDRLHEIIDPVLKNELYSNSMCIFTEIAYQCLQNDREQRPSMSLVVQKLKEALEVQEIDEYEGTWSMDYEDINRISHHPIAYSAKDQHYSRPSKESVKTSAKEEGRPKHKKAALREASGISMIDLFTPEQIREHITGLRQDNIQSKPKAEKYQTLEPSTSDYACQICAVEKLTFELPRIHCTCCGANIKKNEMFYTLGIGGTQHYTCTTCFEARGDAISVNGYHMLKARMEKRKNSAETEEWWVQCDQCEGWQHQICALFNGRRNDGGQAEYTCPNCCIEELERGERKPLPQSAVLGAKDLPRTVLSNHIENRLFARLKQERLERARLHRKSYDEVPGAEALVVRVVSSVDKKLKVNQWLLKIFQNENYPAEFGYTFKVVLLFQKIDGVEVCLFGMYVHEFGAECPQPNNRSVYLSCLDAVKYFRPEIKAVTGESLCTFVYHEILIGYLEYCKLRGFTSCYIWACPQLKGEEYILYFLPEFQKKPKFDKLREWCLSMLKKASLENIVVDLTNLYDQFFVSSAECKTKVTATRLPYFDGDYWPGAAEDIINQLRGNEDNRREKNKNGSVERAMRKRGLEDSGQSDLSGNVLEDLSLMDMLGEAISPMKEDFIFVYLQHSCTHCCIPMVSGKRWVCNQCGKFQLCDKCHEMEQKLEDRERHPIKLRKKHPLYPIKINYVPPDTKDRDQILESEFFNNRHDFLRLCHGNHYQFDTLRRAKYSTMMMLYHLHNPFSPAFVTTCDICKIDVETGKHWRCEVCPDYEVCDFCYHKEELINHPHKLTNDPLIFKLDAQNKDTRRLRIVQQRNMLDLLVHASQCRLSRVCQYPICNKAKGIFRHAMRCKVRLSGGCVLCKKMWYFLQLHAQACEESVCPVPRCRDLKEDLTSCKQSDRRRRVAIMKLKKQHAAEVAGISG